MQCSIAGPAMGAEGGVAYASSVAAAGLVLALSAVEVGTARAEDDEPEREPSPVSMVIFGAMDAGPQKGFASFGIKRALGDGLTRSGFRLFVKAGGSREPRRGPPPRGTLVKAESQAMLGYEWRLDRTFIALYVGSEGESVQTRLPFGVSVPASRYGGRLQADLWSNPVEGMMVQAGAYGSSLDGRLWGRLATGWEMPGRFYLGPEIEAYRESRYRKLRFGAHLTGLRLLGLEWRLAGGWENATSRSAQFYASLGAHWLH